MSVKERLVARVKAKVKELKENTNPFEEYKIPKPGPIYFEFVMRKRVKYDMGNYKKALLLTEMRRSQAAIGIDAKIKELDEEKRISFIKEMVYSVPISLVDIFYDSLPLLEECPNPYYKDLFAWSKVYVHMNHTIVILDRPSSASQIEIEYIGLLWAAKYAMLDEGRDIIVSRDGFRCFCCMMIGMEMYDILKKHPLMKDHQQLFSYQNLTIMTKEFGNLFIPSQNKVDNMLEYVRCVPWWQYY
jgi:hypothetical protein